MVFTANARMISKICRSEYPAFKNNSTSSGEGLPLVKT